MIDEQSLHHVNNEDEIGKVSFPFSKNQLADFLVSLLGKPQSIRKSFHGAFQIDKDYIININQLIDTRIKQQNNGQLLDVKFVITYADNTTVSLSGIAHLISFSEPQPLVSKRITITWQYLIHFHGKDIPEKQEITLDFITAQRRFNSLDYEDYSAYDAYEYYNSEILIQIDHTARTWGADMEALISKHIKTICKRPGYISRLFRGHKSFNFMSTLGVPIFFGITFLFIIIFKIPFDVKKYFYALFLAYFLGKIFVFSIMSFDSYEPPSFVLLTRASYDDQIKTLKRRNKSWIKLVASTVGSILLATLENYIFFFLQK